MAATIGEAWAMLLPGLMTFFWIFIGVGVLGALFYYLFVLRTRRKWNIFIYEQKANGRYAMVGKDEVVEKKINKGKQAVYVLKYRKAEVMPPPDELTDKLRHGEYCDYLRILDDYIPIKKNVSENSVLRDPEKKKKFIQKIREYTAIIKKTPIEDINQRYIYAPINKVLKANINYTPIDYDVNMMRINLIDNREKMYKDKESFLQKYGPLIGVGIAAGVLIVVVYLSFEYLQVVIDQSLSAADKVAQPLAKVVEYIGGTKPPS